MVLDKPHFNPLTWTSWSPQYLSGSRLACQAHFTEPSREEACSVQIASKRSLFSFFAGLRFWEFFLFLEATSRVHICPTRTARMRQITEDAPIVVESTAETFRALWRLVEPLPDVLEFLLVFFPWAHNRWWAYASFHVPPQPCRNATAAN